MVVKRGEKRVIAFAVDASGNCPARDDLENVDFTDRDKAKFIQIVELLAETGVCNNEKMFRKERDDIFGIKGHQLRVGCFWDPNERGVLRLTHAFKKKKNQWSEKEIKRAKKIRLEHIARSSTRK